MCLCACALWTWIHYFIVLIGLKGWPLQLVLALNESAPVKEDWAFLALAKQQWAEQATAFGGIVTERGRKYRAYCRIDWIGMKDQQFFFLTSSFISYYSIVSWFLLHMTLHVSAARLEYEASQLRSVTSALQRLCDPSSSSSRRGRSSSHQGSNPQVTDIQDTIRAVQVQDKYSS